MAFGEGRERWVRAGIGATVQAARELAADAERTMYSRASWVGASRRARADIKAVLRVRQTDESAQVQISLQHRPFFGRRVIPRTSFDRKFMVILPATERMLEEYGDRQPEIWS